MISVNSYAMVAGFEIWIILHGFPHQNSFDHTENNHIKRSYHQNESTVVLNSGAQDYADI